MPAFSRTLLLPFVLAASLAWSNGSAAVSGASAKPQGQSCAEAEFKHYLVKAYAQILWEQAAQLQAGSALYANQYEKWPAAPTDLTPDWLLEVPEPLNIEVLSLKNEKELDAFDGAAESGLGKWEMLHDKAGTLVYVKLGGVSLPAEVCSALESRDNGPGSKASKASKRGKVIPSAKLDYQKLDQCGASGEGKDATLSYFSRNPEASGPEAACEALAIYNAGHGTSYECR